MSSDKIMQEDYCLKSKILIDLLRNNLLMIDDFQKIDYWEHKLKELKQVVDKKYWSI